MQGSDRRRPALGEHARVASWRQGERPQPKLARTAPAQSNLQKSMPRYECLFSLVRLLDVVYRAKRQGKVFSEVHVTPAGSRHSTGGSSFHLLDIEVRGILAECARPCTAKFIETLVPAKPAHGDEACVHQRLASLVFRAGKGKGS